MTNEETIYNIMKDIKGKTPLLLIGGACYIFKRMYKGNIHSISNTEEAKEFISDYYGIDFEKPIVIEDLSLLYRSSILLKFIEETNIPIVFLASKDNLSSPMMSRMKLIIKFSISSIEPCEYISMSDAQYNIDTKGLNQEESYYYLADSCPDLLLFNERIKSLKNKDKLIQLCSKFRRLRDD